jgi:hypothetical protein
MYLGELINNLDSAITYFEQKHNLGRQTADNMPDGSERANLKSTLGKMRAHLHRLRVIRDGLLAERRPGSFVH